MDGANHELLFRDITGKDLEYLDTKITPDCTLNSSQASELLEYLSLNKGFRASALTPRILRQVYPPVFENILSHYTTKENWLKQCYSIQNGSFQNLESMESVPMSKFIAMCVIHQNAMNSINPQPNDPTPE